MGQLAANVALQLFDVKHYHGDVFIFCVISLQIVFPNYLPIANIEVSESNKKDGITCRKEILVIFFRK